MALISDKELNSLQNEVQKLTKQVNQRLVRLEREVKGDTIEIMTLRTKLDNDYMKSWTKGQRVRFSKKLPYIKLQAQKKVLTEFLQGDTTVPKIRKKLKNAQEKYGRPDIDYQDLLDLQTTEEDLYDWITQYMFASEFENLTNWASRTNMSQDNYVTMIINHARAEILNDEDAVEKIKRLYNKFVLGE